MKTRKLLILLFFALSIFSCTKETDEPSQTLGNDQTTVTKMSVGDAQQAFARILSKAVYNHRAVRQFIKTEAIKQFDNDYDVFYPFVKDKKVDGQRTFREVLLSYCDNEKDLDQIEESLPLLNILVPNLSLFCDFTAENWNVTDNEMPVSYMQGNRSGVLYGNGDSIASLGPDEIPGFPILLVKNNERMEVTATTRATGSDRCSYAFISDVFNGTLTPKTRSQDMVIEQESTMPYVKASELDLRVIEAYQEYKQNNKSLDRDYIYYGLSNSSPSNGTLDPTVKEILYKFKIDPHKYFAIADQDGDPHFNHDNGTIGNTSHEKSPLTKDEILSRIWTVGNFEIYFSVYVGKRTETTFAYELAFSITPQELFQVDRIQLSKKHKTMFRHSKYTYTVKPENLKPRWVNVANENKTFPSLLTEPWDIANQSLTINMAIYERDGASTTEKQYTVKSEYTTKADFSFGLDGEGTTTKSLKFAAKLGSGFSKTTMRTESLKVTTQKNSDDLGTLALRFADPIIVSDTHKDTDGYLVHTINNGTVEAMILPKRIRSNF